MQAEELAERIFTSTLGAMEMVSVHLGDQLGVYRFLRDHGPATEADVAKACGIAPRYASKLASFSRMSYSFTVHCGKIWWPQFRKISSRLTS